MRHWLFIVLAVVSSNVCATEIPLENFAKHGDYLNLKLSPDGKHIAARVRAEGRVIMLFFDSETMKVVGGLKPSSSDIIHNINWVNNERVLYELAEKQSSLDAPVPTGELFATNIDNTRNLMLFGYRASDKKAGSRFFNKEDTKATQEILSLLEDDPDHILIIEYPWTTTGRYYMDDRKKSPIISKLNIMDGRKRKVEVIPYPGASALATKDGSVHFIRWQDENGRYHSAFRSEEDQDWQDLSDAFDARSNMIPIGLSENERFVYLSGRTGESDVVSYFSLNLQTGECNEIFNQHATDIEYTIEDFTTGMPAVGITFPGKSEYVYTTENSRTAEIHKALVSAFGGQTVNIQSRTKDGKTLLVHVSSDINPGEYYLFDRDSLNARFIWANRSWIDPRIMVSMQPFRFTTSDNIVLNGYLTLPTSSDTANKPPAVVMIHGGPHQPRTQDYWRYDSEVQLLANRGYAVVQVNFRGSDGYGSQFIKRGYRQWGGKMIDDINAAARWAIANNHVDGNKVCAYGASYGGYAALMATIKAPDLYKCTIGYVGIYDLEDMFKESDIPNSWGGMAYLKKVLGNDKKQLKQYSPITHVDKIKAKVMLIHGAKDRRTPEISAEKLQKQLIKVGNAPVYLRFNQSAHGVYDEKSRVELYKGILDFLAQHIG